MLSLISCCILLSVFVSASRAEESKCNQVSKIDCDNNYTPEGDERVCCSDNKVYLNLCHFAQRKCIDTDLTVVNPGSCNLTTPGPTTNHARTTDPAADITTDATEITKGPTTPDTPTVASPTSNTDDIIRAVFCSNAANITCPSNLDPVCGTDGKFYATDCEFAKAKCKDANLKMQDLTVCKVTHRFKRQLTFV